MTQFSLLSFYYACIYLDIFITFIHLLPINNCFISTLLFGEYKESITWGLLTYHPFKYFIEHLYLQAHD